MFCHNCGKELFTGCNFCPGCGTKVQDAEADTVNTAELPETPEMVKIVIRYKNASFS